MQRLPEIQCSINIVNVLLACYMLHINNVFSIACSKQPRSIQKWAISAATLCLIFFLAPYSGNTEESPQNSLPSPPDTGSPEEDFSAGGTRDNHHFTQVCGENGQKIAYLLGNKKREFTSSIYPTFWFYLPSNVNKIEQIKFVLKELETEKRIYTHAVREPEKFGIIGIAIPPEPQYALSPNVNYSWSLEIDCAESNDEPAIVLEGWLHRLLLKPDWQNQLTAASGKDKYKVYLQQDLPYDALNDLAQRYLTAPNNTQLKTAWNQLLVKLGWQDLTQQSVVEPYILNTKISSNNN